MNTSFIFQILRIAADNELTSFLYWKVKDDHIDFFWSPGEEKQGEPPFLQQITEENLPIFIKCLDDLEFIKECLIYAPALFVARILKDKSPINMDDLSPGIKFLIRIALAGKEIDPVVLQQYNESNNNYKYRGQFVKSFQVAEREELAFSSFVIEILKIIEEHNLFDAIWWRTDGMYAPVTFFAHCSDFFHYASADSEDITQHNIPRFLQACKDLKEANEDVSYAPQLFAARERQLLPLASRLEHMSIGLADLFDKAVYER